MIVAPGSTDVSTYFYLVDPSTGVPVTAPTITALDATYVRDGVAAVKNDLTACAAVDAAHVDNTAIMVDATNAPGLCRVDWPDAAFLTGKARVQLVVNGAAVHPAVIECELVPWLTPVTGATVRAVNAADAALATSDQTDDIPGDVRTELAVELARIDDEITSREASGAAAAALVSTDLAIAAVKVDTAAVVLATDTLEASATTIAAATDTLEASATTIAASVDTLEARLPAALVGGRMDSYVGAMADGVITIDSYAVNAASVAATVIGEDITVYRGTRWVIALTGLTSMTGYTKVYFTVKRHADDPDTAAVVHIQESTAGTGDGLLKLNGATAGTITDGSIVVNSATAVTVYLESASADDLSAEGPLVYGVKWIDATGAHVASAGGELTIAADIPRATT